jgi:MFS family permease
VLMPVTIIMFFLSSRFGALADRIGPRFLMGAGPIVAGAGLLLLIMVDQDPNFATELLPGVTLFGLGLAMTVAPLTATVLAAGMEHAGVASGVNNAVARVAGLIAIAVVGALLSAQFTSQLDDALAERSLDPAAGAAIDDARSRPLTDTVPDDLRPSERAAASGALRDASESAFHVAMAISALLTAAGGVVSALGIQNPRRRVAASECPGGAICGASQQVGVPERAGARQAEPAPA